MLTLSIYISQFISLSNFLEKPKFDSIHTQNIYNKIIIKILGYFWGVTTTLLKVGVCTKCAGGTQESFPVLLPPTLDDHIFRVQTPFGVFLDSMKSQLSQDSFHVPVEGSGCPQPC